jgi:nitrate/nitrite-specific signal transduction histidine kinase
MSSPHKPYQRKHFFINPRLQIHYIIYTSFTLLIVTGVAVASMYFGIWGSVLKEFSSTRIQTALLNAARAQQYEQARHPNMNPQTGSLALFREVELLTQHQKEIWSDILKTTHNRLLAKFFLLVIFIAWGSIFLTHKIAGPLYRLQTSCRGITSGNLKTRAHLRKLDEAKEIAETFNDMAESLDHAVSSLKQIIATEKIPKAAKEKLNAELERFDTTEK